MFLFELKEAKTLEYKDALSIYCVHIFASARFLFYHRKFKTHTVSDIFSEFKWHDLLSGDTLGWTS